MSYQDLHHLAAAYSLDALDADERSAFEAHYPTCEICSRDVVAYRETAAVLAADSEATPPLSLKSNLMAQVAKTQQLSPILPERVVDLAERRRRKVARYSVLATAAAVLVAFIGTVAALRGGSTSDDIRDLVEASDAVMTSLDGADGSVRVIWSAERSEVAVLGDGLDQPADGLTYALWFLTDEGGAAPIGLFEPGRSGVVRTVLAVEGAAGTVDGAGFGVTIEPDGGSAEPTLPVLYSGTL